MNQPIWSTTNFIIGKKEIKEKKPSERIKELAQEIHNKGIDPGFTGYNPGIVDYVGAIVCYLDEQKK